MKILRSLPMPMPLLLFFALLLGMLGPLPASAATPAAPAPAASAPDPDAPYEAKLNDASELLHAKFPQQAIDGPLAEVLAHFEALYRGRPEKIFCAGSTEESLIYLLDAAAAQFPAASASAPARAASAQIYIDPDNGSGSFKSGTDGPPTVAVIGPAWATAYLMKGYALVELGRLAEAHEALEHAIALSPQNSQYLAELAYLYQAEKQWQLSLATYARAEQAAHFAPEQARKEHEGRALRGQGFALTELGRLDEATAFYRKALELDPQDQRSLNELRYIEQQRRK